MRTHISRWLDRIAGILLLFVLSFLWFATRLHGVGWAVLLAGLLTALVCNRKRLAGALLFTD